MSDSMTTVYVVSAWSVTVESDGAVNAFRPAPAAGFVKVAILAPGFCPDAARSETVGVAPGCQAPTSSSMDVSVQGLAEAPVLNCVARLWMARTGVAPVSAACPVLLTSVRAASWPNAVETDPQTQSPTTSGSAHRTRLRNPCRRRVLGRLAEDSDG